jgi:hypothetical protein
VPGTISVNRKNGARHIARPATSSAAGARLRDSATRIAPSVAAMKRSAYSIDD